MEENKKKQAVDIFVIWNRIWQKKKLFCVVGAVSFILACLWVSPDLQDFINVRWFLLRRIL